MTRYFVLLIRNCAYLLSADVYRGMQSVRDFGFRDQWTRAGLVGAKQSLG